MKIVIKCSDEEFRRGLAKCRKMPSDVVVATYAKRAGITPAQMRSIMACGPASAARAHKRLAAVVESLHKLREDPYLRISANEPDLLRLARDAKFLLTKMSKDPMLNLIRRGRGPAKK